MEINSWIEEKRSFLAVKVYAKEQVNLAPTRGSSPAAQLIDVLTQDFIRNSECMECMDILTLSSGASGTNTQYSYLKLGCKIPSMRDGYFE